MSVQWNNWLWINMVTANHIAAKQEVMLCFTVCTQTFMIERESGGTVVGSNLGLQTGT